jgi:murein DD-endopeptidase
MGINWNEMMERERIQFEAMTERERYVFFLLLQYGSPYRWGMENPEGADCSGSVSLALYAATGFLIRTTADELYRRVFTVRYPSQRDIRAVFFLANSERAHGSGTAKIGTAVHVAGLVDDGVILNSQEPKARVRSLSEVNEHFKRTDCTAVIRGLDRAAFETAAKEGGMLFGVDGELARYFVTRKASA